MSNETNVRLSRAVRIALGTGLAATMAFAPVAHAEEEAAELERVQVTGSRISRLDIEGATPIVTIDREDLDNSGFQTVSDYLRSSSFNSFGSFREKSGTSAQGQATLSLRGLGSNRTLVLINGKRLPGSPVQDGQIQNLNTIPFAAVERIEILSDGASAIYGSDAIGGVVNVILRRDFEGGEISIRAIDPQDPGGAERGMSIVNGFSGDRGRLTFAIEADHRDILKNVDRPWLSNQFIGGDPNIYQNYSETSGFSRNITSASGTRPMLVGAVGDPGCSVYGQGFLPNIMGSATSTSTYCRFDYTNVAANTASLDRLSAFMTAEYDINSNLQFTSQILAARVESFGRYAPAAGAFMWTGPTLPQQTITYNGQTVTLAELRGPQADPVTGIVAPVDRVDFRFNNTGVARDTWQTDYQYDFQVGLNGRHFGMDWNANYQYDIYDLAEWGTGYVNIPGLNQAAANGWDPRHPDQDQFAAAVPGMRENANRRGQMVMQRTDIGAQIDGPMLDNGTILFFVGAEYRDEKYFDETQKQAEAGNIIGTSGGSSAGSRSAWAVFGETSIPLADTFELNGAMRYDSYNDFGSEVTGKLSARWQPVDYWLLRASYGTGFRAPSLDNLYQAPAFSASFGKDIVSCTAAGLSYNACAVEQWNTYYTNSLDLDAETSSQWLLGTVFDFNQLNNIDLVLSADLYYTEIDDVITVLGATDIFFAELTGTLSSLPGYVVDRSGFSVEHTAPPLNFGSVETMGLDFKIHYGLGLGSFGNLGFDLQTNFILDYKEQDILGGPLRDQTGRRNSDLAGRPDYRLNLDISWNMGRHTVALHSYLIPSMNTGPVINPSFDASNPATYFFIDDTSEEIDSFFHHNLVYAYETPWNARISIGVNNVTDEEPPLDSALEFDDNLYPYVGQAYTASYTQRF